MSVQPSMPAAVLDSILAQRLARRLCPDCKREGDPSEFELVAAGFSKDDLPATLYAPQGCRSFRGTGFRGRVGIYELMVMSDALRAALVSGANSEALRAIAESEGLVSLRQDGLMRACLGWTSVDEVLRVAA